MIKLRQQALDQQQNKFGVYRSHKLLINNKKGGITMRILIFLVFILVLLSNPWEIRGQQADQSSSLSVSEIPTSPNLLFSRVLVYPREGQVISGLLVGIDNGKFIVRVGAINEKIPYHNLAKVIIETKKKIGRDAIYGLILGTYLGNLIFTRATNQSTAYLEDIKEPGRLEMSGFFALNGVFAAGGGLLGSLAGWLFEKGEKNFYFTGKEQKRQAEWERLKRFVIGYSSPKKVHISIQGGHVFAQISPRYLDLLENAGFVISRYHWYENGYREKASDFNLLRKFQFTISLRKNLETGFSLYWLGEPFIYAHPEDWWIYDDYVDQKTNTKGYYAIGIYKPFLRKLPRHIDWNVGLGLGVAILDFTLESATTVFTDPGYERSTIKHDITKTLLSGVVFTELNFYIQDNLSVGLAADYVFVPTEEAPEIPEANIPAQKLRFGTGSIGFTLGLHF